MSSANRTVDRLRPFTTTIFAEMSALAVRTDAVNLGQGFPDTDGPASLLEDGELSGYFECWIPVREQDYTVT